QHGFDVAKKRVTWELHTEFVTLTWVAPIDDAQNWPDGIGLEVFEAEQLIAAVRIDLINASKIGADVLAGFQAASLCAASIEAGLAEVATDFVADADGFTHFQLAAGDLAALRRAIVVRRLLEIETYRTLALLGLPLARSVTPALNVAEDKLGALVPSL